MGYYGILLRIIAFFFSNLTEKRAQAMMERAIRHEKQEEGGEVKAVICFEMLFPGKTPEEKIGLIAEAGFEAVEFWGWRDKNLPALREACRRHGVEVANFSGHRLGSPAAESTHQAFFGDLREAVGVAKQLGCRQLMILTNELGEGGRVVNAFAEIPDERKFENVLKAVGKALEWLPKDFTILLEPLNTRVDHPGYYLTDMETASRLVRRVADRRFRILCDLYHLGVMGAELEEVLDKHIEDIGYFHIADFPGRHEPGTGGADWPALLRRIRRLGYTGCLGFEYAPEEDSAESLRRIHELWEGLG